MIKYVEGGSGYSHSVGYTYDALNNLTALVETINGTTHTTSYTYDDDNRVTAVTNGSAVTAYIYDEWGRIKTWTAKNGTTPVLSTGYTYLGPSTGTTSGQVSKLVLDASGYDVTYVYEYDGNGNITTVTSGGKTTQYTYDSANQLLREDNQAAGKTWVWTYDNAGNILSKKEYAYTIDTLGSVQSTVNYTYDGTWGDLLTAVNGAQIEYDEIGNPESDGTWTYTWRHGRELASMAKTGTTWTFTYNADGLRTKRTNNSTTYQYVYNGSTLVQMTVGNNTLYFTSDTVTYNGTTYYYAKNLQGDIVAILNASGTAVVQYTYDAWGKLLSTTGSMASTLGLHNPLRYRGYVYDTETGLYYLQSRYYNPNLGRFLNADALVATGQGVLGNNMFAYCNNNPAIYLDTDGMALELVDFDPENDLYEQDIGPTGAGGQWSSFLSTMKGAAKGLNMSLGVKDTSRTENHHLASNKSKKYTPLFKEIADRYNMSLNAKENIIPLEGHSGRHTNPYHEFMLFSLRELDAIAGGNAQIFLEGLAIIAEFIRDNPWLPYAK